MSALTAELDLLLGGCLEWHEELLPVSVLLEAASAPTDSKLEYFIRRFDRGSRFPPVRVLYVKNGDVVILDGDRRIKAAHKAGKDKIPALVGREKEPAVARYSSPSQMSTALGEAKKGGYPVGTLRHWQSGDVRKAASGQWEPVTGQKPGGAAHDKPTKGPKETGAPEEPAKKPPERVQAAPERPVGRSRHEPASAPTEQIPIPKGGHWVDWLPGMPKNTFSKYFDESGQPVGERALLHDKIHRKFFDKVKTVPRDEQPRAIVLMGGPGAGKSALVNSQHSDEYVRVDPDKIKEELPEYREGIENKMRYAAHMVHDESYWAAKRLREHALAARKNVIIDSTGRVAASYDKMIRKMKLMGYHVTLAFPHMSGGVEEGLRRVHKRFEEEGRWVPDHIAKDAYEKCPENFALLKGLADSFMMYDAASYPPRLVWQKDDSGKETVYDQDFVQNYQDQYMKRRRSEAIEALRDLFAEEEEEQSEHPMPVSGHWDSIMKRMLLSLRAYMDRLNKGAKDYHQGEGIEDVVDDSAMEE